MTKQILSHLSVPYLLYYLLHQYFFNHEFVPLTNNTSVSFSPILLILKRNSSALPWKNIAILFNGPYHCAVHNIFNVLDARIGK